MASPLPARQILSHRLLASGPAVASDKSLTSQGSEGQDMMAIRATNSRSKRARARGCQGS